MLVAVTVHTPRMMRRVPREVSHACWGRRTPPGVSQGEYVKNTIWWAHQEALRAGRGPDTDRFSRLREVMLWQGFFDGKFLDKQYAIGAFKRHIQQVKERVPRDRLLVFDVQQGWDPLCRCLNVTVPDKPFPRLFDTAAFRELVRSGGPRPATPTMGR